LKTMRIALAAVAAAAGLLIMAGPAQADPPQAVVPPGTPVVLAGTETAGSAGFCRFPVHIDVLSNQKVRETKNPDGSTTQHVTGWSKATVTNEETGKSITYKISGPGTLTIFPDQSFTIDAGGQNLLWTSVANSFAGVPQLAYSTGHVQVAVNATGLTTAYSLSGNRTDVCAALA
jgi:hypothetical protein